MKKRVQSFKYAFTGISRVTAKDVNFRIHLAAAAAAVLLGFWLGISREEWLAVLLCIGLVTAAEAFNSALERTVNFISPGHHVQAGEIKDIAAGAVLLAACAAAAAGGLIFIPKILERLG